MSLRICLQNCGSPETWFDSCKILETRFLWQGHEHLCCYALQGRILLWTNHIFLNHTFCSELLFRIWAFGRLCALEMQGTQCQWTPMLRISLWTSVHIFCSDLLLRAFVQHVCSKNLCWDFWFWETRFLWDPGHLVHVATGSQIYWFQRTPLQSFSTFWFFCSEFVFRFLFRILAFGRRGFCEILETWFQWTPLADNLSEHVVQNISSEF